MCYRHYIVASETITHTVNLPKIKQPYHRSKPHLEIIRLSQPKIRQLHVPVRRHQQILRLQIPVHNPLAVQEIHPAQYLPRDLLDPRRPQPPESLDVRREILLGMLEHQVHNEQLLLLHPSAVTDVEQPHHVGMLVGVELLEEGDLAEGAHRDAVLGEGDADPLEGDHGAALAVNALVDCAVGAWWR